MGIKESALPQKSLVSTDDFLRVVGSDGSSYKQKVPSVSDSIMMGAAKTIPSGSVNDLTTPGMYYCYSAVTGLPTTGLYRVRVEYYGGAYNQYANPNGSNDIYFRTYSNGAWGSWVKMPTRAEVNALNSKTQSGLSSTSGTFDSWSTVKKNGNICSLSFRMTMTSAVSAWSAIFTLPSGYRPSTDTNLYLPVFLNGAISYMQVQILSNGNVRLATGINNGTTFGFTAIFW